MARQHLPDLILSDVHMPGGDGSNLLAEIRRDPALKSKQVVLMTGRTDLITPRRGMEEGADDFLEKPVSVAALMNCVAARFKRASINWRIEDQMLNELSSSVPPNLPHEFFTPLAGIMGLMEILLESGDSLSPADVDDIHRDVYQSSLRLHRTLRNYLLLLELKNAPPPAKSPLMPNELEAAIQNGIEEAVRINKRREDLHVKLDLCPILITGADLSRVVEELLDNAFKFSRQGTPVTFDFHADGRLIVTDQGRGMTPDQISRVGAFHQFDRNKNEQQGLGLGLALVQKLIASCPATLVLESQPGQGTQATIAFPVQ
jgi:signal transduction histidine kinase